MSLILAGSISLDSTFNQVPSITVFYTSLMVKLSQRDIVPWENVKFELKLCTLESTVSYVGVSKIEDYFFFAFLDG